MGSGIICRHILHQHFPHSANNSLVIHPLSETRTTDPTARCSNAPLWFDSLPFEYYHGMKKLSLSVTVKQSKVRKPFLRHRSSKPGL